MLFEVTTPLGFQVHITKSSWEFIVSFKHPVMKGREGAVMNVLQFPDEIRQSRRDPDVYLFYKLDYVGRWTCVVTRRLNGEGFVITTYPTDAVKAGEPIWSR